jgi:RND family efflux transporter MFP subunit
MKKQWMIVLICVVLLVAGWMYYASRPKAPIYETATVERGTVENIVSVTGHVEPVDRVMLSFTQGGRVARIAVKEGQQVRAGDIVAALDQDVLLGGVGEARARADRESAALTALIAPLPTKDRAVKEATVAQAQQSEASSIEGLYSAFARAFTSADDAIHNKADALFSGGSVETKKFGIHFEYGNTEYTVQGTASEETALKDGRQQSEAALIRINDRENTRVGDVADTARATEDDLTTIDTFLTQLADVVNSYVPKDSEAQIVYEGFQTSIASARTAVATARSDVRAAHAAYDAASAARALAEHGYTQALAGVTSETRAVQEATLAAAQASVVTAQESADKAVLRAPLAGLIASITPSVGETVSPNSPVAELLTAGAYEVEVYIPEADIARVKIGDKARLTFDAFDRTKVFDAEVVRIALVETVREGVPTYKTTLMFTGTLPAGVVLRPGMTADVEITTDVRKDVLSVVARSVLTDKNRTYVRILNAESALEERDVVTGLRGSEGTIEITSGLQEGEKVVVFVQE